MRDWVPKISKAEAAAIAAVAVNALLGKHATSTLLYPPKADLPDEPYIAEWTTMLTNRIEALLAAQ